MSQTRIANARAFQCETKRRSPVLVVVYRYPDDRATHLTIGGKYIGIGQTTQSVFDAIRARVVLRPGEAAQIKAAVAEVVAP